MTEIVEIDSFAKSQQSKVLDNDMSDEISQIIMFNLCHSKTMMNSFESSEQRITVAYQYLTTILSKIYGYKIQSVQGLVSFNNEATVKCPFSLFVDDIETKGFDNFSPESGVELWNSIKLSCNEIIKFRKDKSGKEIFKRARSRIIIITDNCDEISEEEIALLLKMLIENKIVVDSIILNNAKKKSFWLALLCFSCNWWNINPA